MTEMNIETEMTKSTTEPIYQKLFGSVNWFNRKKGYGFITIITPDSDIINQDIFTHYTSINSSNYKVLYPGEYVQLDIIKNEEDKLVSHNVSGIFGGNLLTDNTKYHYKISQNKQID